MKKTFYTLALIMLACIVFGQEGFTIIGQLKQMKYPVASVILKYNGYSDSVVVKNGQYIFKGVVAGPVRASMMVRFKKTAGKPSVVFNVARDSYAFFLENSEISITSVDSFSQATVKGSRSNEEIIKLDAMNKDLDAQSLQLSRQFSAYRKAGDEEGLQRIKAESAKVQDAKRNNYKIYLQDNPSSPIGIYVINRYATFYGIEINPAEVEPVFMLLAEDLRNSVGGKMMAHKIDAAKKTGIGVIAQDFTQNDTLGNPVRLSSFRGKYLLLDFWADWCFPCRRENPNLVAAYHKFKSKGFDILSVALEKSNAKEKWMKAIHDDKLTWTHVSDMKYWDNEVARMYGIEVVPSCFLLDPEGRIIAKDLRGEALHAKLAELLK